MPRFEESGWWQWVVIGGIGASALLFVIKWSLGLLGMVITSWMLLALRRPDRSAPSTQTRLVTDGGERDIEMITAIIRPGKLNAVKQALVTAGAPSLTVTNVSGRGTQPTETGQWRGEEYIVDLHQKVKVEVVVTDEKTEDVIAAIQNAAHTGEPGDGKIWVLPVRDAVRVSTEERGPAAI